MSTANRNGDEIWIRKHRKHRNKEVIGVRKAKRSTVDRNEDVICESRKKYSTANRNEDRIEKQRGVQPTEMRMG